MIGRVDLFEEANCRDLSLVFLPLMDCEPGVYFAE